jgi:hypothetical protein
MDVEWPPLREPAAERVWRQVLQPIGVDLRQQATELAEMITTRIRDDMPDLFVDSQMFEEVIRSTRDSLRQLSQMIERGEDPKNIDIPRSVRAVVRSGVWRSVPLAVHMRFYRLAQERVWHWLFAQVTESAEDPETLKTAAELTTSWLLSFVDRALLLADQAYELERETWSRGASAARTAAIEDILAERERDERAASLRLRYEISRHHIGVVATWVDQRDPGAALSVLSEAIASVARIIGAEATITQPAGSLAIAGWLSARRPFPANIIPAADDGLRAWRLPPCVSMAAGEPAFGLKGFRRTHIEAHHASRVALLVSSHTTSFMRYRDAALTALCTADDHHAAAFVRRALGPLAANDKDSYRLSMTLAVYLRENQSRTRTAEVLQIHPNTVSYRVRQAEELLQRTFERDTVDLQVALAVLPALGRLEHNRPDEQ